MACAPCAKRRAAAQARAAAAADQDATKIAYVVSDGESFDDLASARKYAAGVTGGATIRAKRVPKDPAPADAS